MLPRESKKENKGNLHSAHQLYSVYTAISRKVVEKSARDNRERYCGWF